MATSPAAPSKKPSAQHGSAGILSAPLDGSPGLVLTFASQPQLDVTHQAIGHVLAGRRVLRHIAGLARLCGGAHPRQESAVLRVVGPKEDATANNGDAKHDFLLIEAQPASSTRTGESF